MLISPPFQFFKQVVHGQKKHLKQSLDHKIHETLSSESYWINPWLNPQRLHGSSMTFIHQPGNPRGTRYATFFFLPPEIFNAVNALPFGPKQRDEGGPHFAGRVGGSNMSQKDVYHLESRRRNSHGPLTSRHLLGVGTAICLQYGVIFLAVTKILRFW